MLFTEEKVSVGDPLERAHLNVNLEKEHARRKIFRGVFGNFILLEDPSPALQCGVTLRRSESACVKLTCRMEWSGRA